MFVMIKKQSQEQNHEGKSRKDETIFYWNLLAPEITQTCVLENNYQKPMNLHIFKTNTIFYVSNQKHKI